MTPHQQTWWPIVHPQVSQSSGMPFDSAPEFPRLLGLVLERWTVLESTLAKCLACLLDDNEIAARAIIYSLNATSIRIAMVRAVAKELVPDGPEKRGFLWLLDKINDLQRQRNEFIHGEYWHGPESGFDLLLIRPMNAESFTVRPVTEGDLRAHLMACEEREFQLSLAIDPEPQRNVPQSYWQRRELLSRYRSGRV